MFVGGGVPKGALHAATHPADGSNCGVGVLARRTRPHHMSILARAGGVPWGGEALRRGQGSEQRQQGPHQCTDALVDSVVVHCCRSPALGCCECVCARVCGWACVSVGGCMNMSLRDRGRVQRQAQRHKKGSWGFAHGEQLGRAQCSGALGCRCPGGVLQPLGARGPLSGRAPDCNRPVGCNRRGCFRKAERCRALQR